MTIQESSRAAAAFAPLLPTRVAFANGLRMRYLDWASATAPVVLLHGLSANGTEFAAVGTALAPHFRVVAPDLRGRGGTDKPPSGYTMADHAADVVALLDTLGLERVVLGGHSFGGYLATWIASHFPARVSRLVVIDAATEMNPRVREMLGPSLARLRRSFPSAEHYLEQVRAAPYMDGTWDWAIEAYFRAELVDAGDGTVRSSTSADAIAQAMEHVLAEPWREIMASVRQPVLLVHAPADYGPPGAGAIVPDASARETVALFTDVRYVPTSGNHLTMMFGEHALQVARAIADFAADGGGA